MADSALLALRSLSLERRKTAALCLIIYRVVRSDHCSSPLALLLCASLAAACCVRQIIQRGQIARIYLCTRSHGLGSLHVGLASKVSGLPCTLAVLCSRSNHNGLVGVWNDWLPLFHFFFILRVKRIQRCALCQSFNVISLGSMENLRTQRTQTHKLRYIYIYIYILVLMNAVAFEQETTERGRAK